MTTGGSDDQAPRVPAERRELRSIRWLLVVFTGFAAVMLVSLVLAAQGRAHDPRATATVTSLLPATKACHSYATVSYSTPDGLLHHVPLCTQDATRRWEGQTVQIRYSAHRPNDEVAPAVEDRITPVVPIPAVLLVVGVIALWFAWRRPEAMLRAGFRYRGPRFHRRRPGPPPA